ncbi:MAG: hypothetical protein LWX11_05430 [Firmicutes bacterium]|nr:hypothetical protein [Bacillota bacterium]
MDPYSSPLMEAPGARASRICGIWAIILAFTCIGLPVAFILGVVALVQHSKAKRLAQQLPDQYLQPGASGLVLGIVSLVLPFVMLPFIGIVSAIAIPALLGQRERAREKAVISHLQGKLPELAQRYEIGLQKGSDLATLKADLESDLQASPLKNPYNPALPTFHHTIRFSSATSEAEAIAEAKAQVGERGEILFTVTVPTTPHGFACVAGAVRLKDQAVEGSVYGRAISIQ